MPIDTLKALARNALKKTGDTMISGFLTLFQDPVDPLHAVTKQYVDNATAGVFDPRPRATAKWYTQQFSNTAGNTTGPAVVGDGRMALLFAGGSHSWDRIAIHVAVVGTRTARLGVYSMNSTTLLPTALLVDAGTVSFAGLVDIRSIVISLSTTAQWLGLAYVLETTGTGSYLGRTFNLDNGSGGFQFFGTDDPSPSGGIVNVNNVLVCSTGIAGMPAPGAWSYDPATSQTLDGGVFLRKSA
jgi:hypothetical protein